MLEFLCIEHLIFEISCHYKQNALRYEEYPFDAKVNSFKSGTIGRLLILGLLNCFISLLLFEWINLV